MDTRWRNIKYSGITKGIAVFLVWLGFMSAAASGMFLLYNEEVMTSDSFYQTRDFRNEFSRAIYNTVEQHVKQSPDAVKSGDSEQSIKNQILIESADHKVNFAYYIKNLETGEVMSNVSDKGGLELIEKQPSYGYINSDTESGYGFWYSEEIHNMLSAGKSEIHAAVIEPLKEGDIFYTHFARYSKVKTAVNDVIILIFISLAIMMAAFIYLLYAAGRKEENGEVSLMVIDKMYTDVHALLVFVAAAASIAIVAEASNGSDSIMFIVTGIVLGIDACIGLSFVLSMVRQLKNKQLFQNSLTYKFFIMAKKYAAYAFNGKLFKAWILLALVGYGAVNSVLLATFRSTSRYGLSFDFLISSILLLGFNLFVLYVTAKSLRNLVQIMEAAKEISKGNLDYPIHSAEMSPAFVGFAENLQGIQRGLQKAVAEAVKGERMKTELITNVSHDLKTPLTSIVSYVDLLKKEELHNDKAAAYLDVLEEKSARLKQLIEDLIEASKASSGNLSVAAEKVDFHQLVMQAYGEYQDKIENAALDMRISAVDKDIFVKADGKHLWRIVENLLSNAVKYSMTHSRVYINLDRTERNGVLTIKNMSAFPLDISPDQLTERFVRGDASRTTEGSGLGLSIAQSLTKLQGGAFTLEIDGDLFKVTVELPLWIEE